jgi:hypothetical protein
LKKEPLLANILKKDVVKMRTGSSYRGLTNTVGFPEEFVSAKVGEFLVHRIELLLKDCAVWRVKFGLKDAVIC